MQKIEFLARAHTRTVFTDTIVSPRYNLSFSLRRFFELRIKKKKPIYTFTVKIEIKLGLFDNITRMAGWI